MMVFVICSLIAASESWHDRCSVTAGAISSSKSATEVERQPGGYADVIDGPGQILIHRAASQIWYRQNFLIRTARASERASDRK
jgi:hypothetical protein